MILWRSFHSHVCLSEIGEPNPPVPEWIPHKEAAMLGGTTILEWGGNALHEVVPCTSKNMGREREPRPVLGSTEWRPAIESPLFLQCHNIKPKRKQGFGTGDELTTTTRQDTDAEEDAGDSQSPRPAKGSNAATPDAEQARGPLPAHKWESTDDVAVRAPQSRQSAPTSNDQPRNATAMGLPPLPPRKGWRKSRQEMRTQPAERDEERQDDEKAAGIRPMQMTEESQKSVGAAAVMKQIQVIIKDWQENEGAKIGQLMPPPKERETDRKALGIQAMEPMKEWQCTKAAMIKQQLPPPKERQNGKKPTGIQLIQLVPPPREQLLKNETPTETQLMPPPPRRNPIKLKLIFRQAGLQVMSANMQ